MLSRRYDEFIVPSNFDRSLVLSSDIPVWSHWNTGRKCFLLILPTRPGRALFLSTLLEDVPCLNLALRFSVGEYRKMHRKY